MTERMDRVWLLRAMCHVDKCDCADRGGRVDDYEACRIVSRHANAILDAIKAVTVGDGEQLRPDMLAHIIEIQRQLVAEYGFKPRTDAPGIPANVPDGIYPMTIKGKVDKVEIKNGMISCCNFD